MKLPFRVLSVVRQGHLQLNMQHYRKQLHIDTYYWVPAGSKASINVPYVEQRDLLKRLAAKQ